MIDLEQKYALLKKDIFSLPSKTSYSAIEDFVGYPLDIDENANDAMDEVFEQMPEEDFLKFYDNYFANKTERLHINMTYTYSGMTGIDIPLNLLVGKSEEEKLEIAYQYAKEHIDEIPVSDAPQYLEDSDSFEIDDIDFDEY